MLRSPRRLLRYIFVVSLIAGILYFNQRRALTQSRPLRDAVVERPGDKPVGSSPPPARVKGQIGLANYKKSTFDWSAVKLKYPVNEMIHLPTGRPRVQPKIQHTFTSSKETAQVKSRQDEVRIVFKKCWTNYRKYAWMNDELSPLTHEPKETFGGWAATLIDALDTLWIMDLKEDFYEAVEAVATLDWEETRTRSCNMFETTIRHLGGLLSAYDLSQEKVLLKKAIELGDMLYLGFDTPNRTPGFWLNYENAKEGKLKADEHVPSASPASLSLEFTRLSQVSGNPKYYEAITRITLLLEAHQNSTQLPGMWPTYINLRDELFTEPAFTLGALADSLYEYLPKMHALLGGLEPIYEKMARYSLDTVVNTMLFRPMLPNNDDILVSGNIHVSDDKPLLIGEGQHLTCFIGGMFALSGRLFGREDYVEKGAKLTRGCIYAYNAFPTGIMPEIFTMWPCDNTTTCAWDEQLWQSSSGSHDFPKGFRAVRESSYILRPEAIESVFLLYRITGLEEFRDSAWTMFEAIVKATETEFGNAGILNVNTPVGTKPEQKDSMESFWMAETLKYFYLIFSSPDLINLDEYVFNTEAHPLKRLIH